MTKPEQREPTLPITIDIGPYVYAVTQDKAAYNQVIAKWGNCVGYVDHDALLIVLDPEPTLGQKRDTLLHEVKHAVWHLAGAHPNGKLDEETIVARQTTMELDTFRRNPALIAYLTAPDV